MRSFTKLLLPLLALVPPLLASYQPAAEKVVVQEFMNKYSKHFYPTQPALAPNAVAKKPTSTSTATSSPTSGAQCDFWYEDIKHQGVAAFNPTSDYVVYRNVKDYGAMGDGVTDDTAAINLAISSGNRDSMTSGYTSTNTLAVVYFPAGTYLISGPIQVYYYTQLLGNPNCVPTILGATNYTLPGGYSPGMIEGNENYATGSTNIFYRHVENFIVDARQIPASVPVAGIHWDTAQATSLQNVVFYMSDAPGTQHIGFLAQDGSAGWLADVVIYGGAYGMMMGNQQWTMRNISVSNSPYCIILGYDWGWTFQGLNLNNCSKAGIDMTSGGYGNPPDQQVHAVIVIDSTFSNMPLVAMNTAWTPTANPPAGGQLILENIQINNVSSVVYGLDGVSLLDGTSGSMMVDGYLQGHVYTPNGPNNTYGPITPYARPASLIDASGSYFTMSKPMYANVPASQFLSARSAGAQGNGMHDDTAALNRVMTKAAKTGKNVFLDAGTYLVTKTIFIPAGVNVVGEGYAVIMSSGQYFNNVMKPRAVVQVGNPGDVGTNYVSNLIVSTGNQAGKGQIGAILIQWNLASSAAAPSGMWDTHTRIGGFIGSNFEGATCPKTPSSPKSNPNQLGANCYAAFMSLYITPSAEGLYLENNWFWTADHDIDPNDGGNQITVYTGRGMLVESKNGPIWLWGTAVEHHAMYQYSFINTRSVFMGQIQTETAYWQPNPNASVPFAVNPLYSDPVFPSTPYTGNSTINVPNADGWGLRGINSTLYIYGAGHYSFFNNYATTCSNQGNTTCQSRIVEFSNSEIYLYDLHTVGTQNMFTLNGVDMAFWQDNEADFTDNIARINNTMM